MSGGLLENFKDGLGNYSGTASAPASAGIGQTVGNPFPKSAQLVSVTNLDTSSYNPASITNETDTYTLVTDAPSLFFNGKFTSTTDLSMQFSTLIFDVSVYFTDLPIVSSSYYGFNLLTIGGTASPWLQFEVALTGHTAGDVINKIVFTALSSLGAASQTGTITCYIDSVSVGTVGRGSETGETEAETSTPRFGTALPETRYLGLSADSSDIYLTSIEGGTLTFREISNSDFSTDYVSTFGTAAYTDPDSFTKGIYPVCKPGSDRVVYVRGRDGASKQVWYNDLNGTAGWQDIGPGTATWGTAKYAVALMPWPTTPSDVIAAFYDDDVYRTQQGTMNWVKMGDAGTGLRAAARSDMEGHKLLLAGTAAGTLRYSQNYGDTFGTAGTAAGTINSVEWSY